MQERRLAAIMFTDIVGYTSLMGSDEKKAFEILRKNRRIHWRLISKHKGRLLKEVGDGILASFSSSINAVMCALSIQKAAKELEIPLRIGIHQGDVIFEKNDVLGDGVNIASRVQSVADINVIVISETVYKDIKNKEGLQIEALGTKTLKGIDSPVGLFNVTCQDESLLDFSIDTGELVRPIGLGRISIIAGIIVLVLLSFAVYYLIPKTASLSETRKNVLVLPPDNYLGTDTLDYLVAGMHDALISDMGKIGALNVISRTSAVAYKNEGKSIPDLASEHNIDFIIEPSILCYGDSVCTRYKVYDDQENELMVQDLNIERSQILNLFIGITKKFAEEINLILTPEQQNLLAETRMVDDEAYDLYMKGRYYIEQITSREALAMAAGYFKQAIEKDPTWASPYAGLAELGIYQRQFSFIPQDIINPLIVENTNKALELDPDNVKAHFANAISAFAIEWNWDKSEREYKKALELNPNDAMSHVFYAHLLASLRRTEEAVYQAKKAVEIDPLNPYLLDVSAIVLNDAGDYQTALAQAEKALSIEPEQWLTYSALAGSYLAIGDTLKWYEIMRNKLWWWRDDSVFAASLDKAFAEEGFIGAIKERIRQNEEVYSKGGQILFTSVGDRYIQVGNYDKAMDYYEKAYEIHAPGIHYIGIKSRYDHMKDNPRYIALLKKMNLPVD